MLKFKQFLKELPHILVYGDKDETIEVLSLIVVDNVATVTTRIPHTCSKYEPIKIVGCNEKPLNNKWEIDNILSSTQFTFPITIEDVVATGDAFIIKKQKPFIFDLELELKNLKYDDFVTFILDLLKGVPYKTKTGYVTTVTDDIRIPFFVNMMNNNTFRLYIKNKYGSNIDDFKRMIMVIVNSFKDLYVHDESVWSNIFDKLDDSIKVLFD